MMLFLIDAKQQFLLKSYYLLLVNSQFRVVNCNELNCLCNNFINFKHICIISMVDKELNKLKWIKILMCVFLMIRTYQVVVSYYYYQLNLMTEEILFTGFYSIVLLGLLLTKYEILFASILLLIQYKFDDYYHCHAVNSNIVCFISFFIVVVQYNFRKFIKNAINEQVLLERIYHYQFLLVAFWSLLHFVSVFVHFTDVNWTNGKALGLVLCNPFFI